MILDEICVHKIEEVAAQKKATPIERIKARMDLARPPRDFRESLRREGMSLIAEVKRASPTKGVFLENADPADIASVYERAGARAISVLTDEKYFQGSLEDFQQVQKAVDLPCLRKEFIVDAYQIYEARAANADAILLIVRILTDEQLRDYLSLARELGMGVLVETHDANEVERAMMADAAIIGINNRDLQTFEVNIDTTLELKKMVPGGKVLVSESGIENRDQVRRLEDGGVDAILVGETLVTSPDIAGTIRSLLHDDEG